MCISSTISTYEIFLYSLPSLGKTVFFYPIYLELTTSFVTGAIYVFACSTWWVNHEWKGVMFETSENHVKDVYSQQAESGELSQFQPISSGKMTITHL